MRVKTAAAALALAAAATGCTSASPAAAPAEPAATTASQPTLRDQIAAGAVVLFVRHAEAGGSEAVGGQEDCPAESGLVDEGREQVAGVAAGLAALDPPVTEIWASDTCRSLVTAQGLAAALSSPPEIQQTTDVVDGEALAGILTRPVPSGEVRLVIGHNTPFRDATGLGSPARGTTVVLEQAGERLVEVARLSPQDWRELAEG